MKRAGLKHPAESRPWILPAVIGVTLIYIFSTFHISQPKSAFDVLQAGRLPVLNGGRIKPLDTIGRNSLLMISGKQSVRTPQGAIDATAWLLETMFKPDTADGYDVFQIDDPDVLGLLGIQQTNQRRFSFNDLRLSLAEIDNQAERANQVKPEERSRFESSLLVLHSRLMLYHKLQNTIQPNGLKNVADYYRTNTDKLAAALASHMHAKGGASGDPLKDSDEYLQELEFLTQMAEFFPIPQADGNDANRWISIGDGLLRRLKTGELDPAVTLYSKLSDAFRDNEAGNFNATLNRLNAHFEELIPDDVRHVRYEFLFNHAEPFYTSILIYVAVFLLAFFYFLFNRDRLQKLAFALLAVSFALHTFGLISRIWIQGRPPVTNLYSSAIFVGWVAVLLGIVLERIYRRGIGSVVASFIGFTTLIIAHNLANQGDTMEMMRAVLDSNFWLATHVITVTVGYGSTFISGVIGATYLIRRLWDKKWKKESADLLVRMAYGVICFSTFFSFLGTILGGIWADQSWGRFWGWDPKENGALMIVLWNVFILHARVSKSFDAKSIMIMAVFGNIITALSWFGVNMLGIGLHSYGFMDKAFVWLLIFIGSQVLIMGLGWIPEPARKNPDPPRNLN